MTRMRTEFASLSFVGRGLTAFVRAGMLAVLLIAACKKPVIEAPPPEAIPESPAAPPTPATPSPSPATPPPRTVEATPAPNYLAPAGVFFLLTQVSVETPSGITGLRPGTQLQQTGPGEFTAQDGHKLILRPDQVTNDLRIAQQIAGADAAAQNALRRMSAPRPAPAAPAPAIATPLAPAPPANASRPAAPAPRLGGAIGLGAAHSRVKDGYVWEKDRQGVWIRVRPVQ